MMMCSECPTVFVDAETVSFYMSAHEKDYIWMVSFNKKANSEFWSVKVHIFQLAYKYIAKYNSSVLDAVTCGCFWFWPLPARTLQSPRWGS